MSITRAKAIRYRVLFTPRVSFDAYGDEIDVSDRIDTSGISSIRTSIDAGDYQLGVFTTSDVTIKGYNFNGYFNDNDTRSIFMAGRDRTKVRIQFIQFDDNGEETASINFRGLINEEATRLDIIGETIKFKVLSKDSIIRKTKIPAGLISDGVTVSAALLSIFQISDISGILSSSSANINPSYDFTIDSGSVFDNKNAKSIVDQLLQASNSVMLINSSDEIIIQSRDEDNNTEPFKFYGKSDEYGRENIIDITSYNNGMHRMFTSVQVNNTIKTNAGYQEEFGARTQDFTFNFVTEELTETVMANTILDEFKSPKIEMNIMVPTSEVLGIKLLDRATVNYPLRSKPSTGTDYPVYDISKYGSATYPDVFGSTSIDPRVGFKVIEIAENPQSFTTILKLRQIGVSIGDGYVAQRGNAVYDAAFYDESIYGPDNGDVYSGIYGAGRFDNETTTYS